MVFLNNNLFSLCLLYREENDPNVKVCISMKGDETTITSDSGMAYDFMYDYSLWSCTLNHPDYIGQKTLYELMARPLLNSAFEGYNTCLFAYGQVILKHIIIFHQFFCRI